MSTNTSIEWTDATWNTLSGCTRISEGCLNCYIERTPPFRMAHRKFDSPEIGGSTGIILHEDRLDLPLHWRNPRRVFVNSLADLFHDDVPTEHIAKVFATMAQAERHTFQVLTKRPARMRSLLRSGEFAELVWHSIKDTWTPKSLGRELAENLIDHFVAKRAHGAPMRPLSNVWLGTSVESQRWADIRIPKLLETPAAVRFLSCEPLLGPIDLAGPIHADGPLRGSRTKLTYWLTGEPQWGPDEAGPTGVMMQSLITGPRIDWVIVGGESGPGAKPMHPDWARKLRDQCVQADVPFFFKQFGEWGLEWPLDKEGRIVAGPRGMGITVANDGTVYQPGDLAYPDGPRYGEAIRAGHNRANLTSMYRLGKHAAGRELDGRTWDGQPRVPEAVAA